MPQEPFSVVTGAFSYTGGFIARRLLASGHRVRTLTGHPDPMGTVFAIAGYEERAEIGMACHVVLLRDERDGGEYVVECGIMGPGLPVDAFAPVDGAA